MASSIHLPIEICDLIALQVDSPKGWVETRESRQIEEYDVCVIERLKALRLVNRAFHRSASPRLFRCVRVMVKTVYDGEVMANLSAISQSRYAPLVRQLEICFCAWWRERSQKALNFPSKLVIFLSRLPNLEVLQTVEDRLLDHESIYERMSFSITIAKAMRNLNLFKLRELRLCFDSTAEFDYFFDGFRPDSILVEELLRSLRHLRIQIYRNDFWWSSGYSGSPTGSFYRFIDAAEDLESLEISYESKLNLNELDTSRLTKLRILTLQGAEIRADTLISLLEACKETITRVIFRDVTLCTGSWQDVFITMCHLPYLNFVLTQSSHSLTDILRFEEVSTTDWLDIHALGDLQREVISRREAQGLPPMPFYNRAALKPLREARKGGEQVYGTVTEAA